MGPTITNDGKCKKEIRRIGMAKSAMARLANISKYYYSSVTTKVRLVRTVVFSIFIYGAETWTIRRAERKKIDAFEMWRWRRIFRIPWIAHRINTSVLAEVRDPIISHMYPMGAPVVFATLHGNGAAV